MHAGLIVLFRLLAQGHPRDARGLDAEQEFLNFPDAIGSIYADVHDAGTWNEATTVLTL